MTVKEMEPVRASSLVQPRKVEIGTIHDINCPSFQKQQAERANVMELVIRE
jgi:hypothetical protein